MNVKWLVEDTAFDEDLIPMIDEIKRHDIEPHRMIVVAEPQNIECEWRFVIVEKQVIAGCPYKSAGLKETQEDNEQAKQFAQQVAQAGYNPDVTWTLDVCKIRSGAFRLLEINSFSCSGLYECEIEPIVREVSRVAWKEWIFDVDC